MVCKKDVYEWFHNLDAPSRIEVVCELLKMCLPLELRLFGSCLEDLARKDFLPLKEFELKANAFKGLENVEELAQAETRSLLITYLCLVHPSNKQCSGILFKMLSSLVPKLETLQTSMALDEYLEDVLLLMTIAVHHPAFCFEQKQKLIKDLNKIKTLCVSKQNGFGSQHTGPTAATTIDSMPKSEAVPRSSSAVRSDVTAKRDMRMIGYSYPTAVSLVGVSCRGPANCTIEVTWNNLQKSLVSKTMDDLSSFHLQLTGWCSTANLAGASFEKSKMRMQLLFQGASVAIRRGTLHAQSVKKLSSYFNELLKAHDTIPKCDIVRQFFSTTSAYAASSVSEERDVSVHPLHHGDTVSSKMRSKSDGAATPGTGSTASAKTVPPDELLGYKLPGQAMVRKQGSQTTRSATSVVAIDQPSATADFASRHGSQESLLLPRSVPVSGLPANERHASRVHSPGPADAGQQGRRPAVKAGPEAAADIPHAFGSGHLQYPGITVVKAAAAAAAASCASDIQPVAGSMLREAFGGHPKKAPSEAASNVSGSAAKCAEFAQVPSESPRSTPPACDEPAAFSLLGSNQQQLRSSGSSPEASSASDGSEADPNALSLQQSMSLLHPHYPPYRTLCFTDGYGPQALPAAPSTSQVSPSNPGPATFGQPMGTPSISQLPYVPPPHGSGYATFPSSRGLPGGIIFSHNGVPGVRVGGSGVAGDLFFSSRPGTYYNVSSQGISHAAAYHHRPIHPGHLLYPYPSNQGSRKSCYNCGQVGHRASNCPEPFLESLSAGQYRLNYES